MKKAAAEIIREYGPFEDVTKIGGVTFDGERVWLATGDKLQSGDPARGAAGGAINVAAHAGTAWDGKYLYQIAESNIHKIDPESGKVLASIPAPGGGGGSGRAGAEG